MAKKRLRDSDAPSRFNPWLTILVLAPIPLIVVAFFLYKWNSRSDFRKMADQLLQRQNAVLAMDSMEAARQLSVLLDNAARDAQVLSLIPPTEKNLLQFYLSKVADVSEVDARDESIGMIPLPTYSEISLFTPEGNEQIRLKNGKPSSDLRKNFQCTGNGLCDPSLFAEAKKLSIGQAYYGKLLRWFTPRGEPEVFEGAILPVMVKNARGFILLGIDYRFIKEILMHPTFPYERKRDLLQSYQSGNYIYLVDSHYNFIAHPKIWHVTGIDKKTGKRVETIKMDDEEGTKSMNVADYRGGKLKHFDRMMKRSFLQKSVDIFQSSDLKGTNRVMSVAPILTNRGQFKSSGVFGYVIVGCNIEYFEEPKERYVPYY